MIEQRSGQPGASGPRATMPTRAPDAQGGGMMDEDMMQHGKTVDLGDN